MMHGTPAGTAGRAQDIASAAVDLAGDVARFVHGTVIDVDGGRIGAPVIAA
jgi:NAD(P)-dependent dehydrogenase (short-subunit alcohol dehydrogenase family)